MSHITDVATKEVLVGSTTVGTTMNDFPLLLNDLLGYKFKLVRGYKGTPEINIATERGEIHGNGGVGLASVKTLSQNWIDEKKIKFIVQYNCEPSPELAGVPMVMDLAKTEVQRQAMRLLFARTEYARPYFLPPDVPARARAGAAARLRRHHEGPGLRRRRGEAPARAIADDWRSAAGAGRRPRHDAAGDHRPRQAPRSMR